MFAPDHQVFNDAMQLKGDKVIVYNSFLTSRHAATQGSLTRFSPDRNRRL